MRVSLICDDETTLRNLFSLHMCNVYSILNRWEVQCHVAKEQWYLLPSKTLQSVHVKQILMNLLIIC